jgi:conjugal transfer/entry exclusion protein
MTNVLDNSRFSIRSRRLHAPSYTALATPAASPAEPAEKAVARRQAFSGRGPNRTPVVS